MHPMLMVVRVFMHDLTTIACIIRTSIDIHAKHAVIITIIVFAFILGILVSSNSAGDPNVPDAVALSPAPFDAVRGAGYPLPYLPPTGAFASTTLRDTSQWNNNVAPGYGGFLP